MKCVHTSNSRLIKHPYTRQRDPATDYFLETHQQRHRCHSSAPFVVAMRSARRLAAPGERPTNGSDEGTYRKGLPCNPKNYFAKNATRYLHTQDFIVVCVDWVAANQH